MARRRLPGRDSRGRFVKGHGLAEHLANLRMLTQPAPGKRIWHSFNLDTERRKFHERMRERRAARRAAEAAAATEPHGFTMTHGGFTMTHGRRRRH